MAFRDAYDSTINYSAHHKFVQKWLKSFNESSNVSTADPGTKTQPTATENPVTAPTATTEATAPSPAAEPVSVAPPTIPDPAAGLPAVPEPSVEPKS